jgi:WD40 repeat protein
VLRLAWSPDGKILAVSAGEHIYLYPTGSFEGRKDITAKGSCPGMAFSPGGELLACGGRDGVVHVWETATGAERFAIAAHKKAINAVAFSPEGNLLASAGNDGMARLWEVSSSAKNGEMIGGSFAIPALAFSLDGASLAIANAKVVRWRDIETGRFVQTLRSEEAIFSLALSPDGSTLAAGSSTGNVLRWDLVSGEAMPPLDGKAVGLVWQVTYSSDGKLLASASADGVIRVWEVGTGSLLLNLTAHQKAATSLAFSPDGLWLASGGLDGRVILWTVDLK